MGAKPSSFKKKLLASSISSCMLASLTFGANAQEDAKIIEEVQVFGIRAATEAAMDIKRDSTGVVDAISAEDIGKMPDANLAESLQRITGISIDRTNGEGSRVTVRGIDPSMNMVTLNGRNMPAVTNNGNVDDTASRAFDFANLASEVVNGVEVYKTGNAAITSGGLGAVINIKTLRPLEVGEQASIGVKAVHDTTVRNGDDLTPEISGLYSWTDDDSVFGVAVAGSYQVRDNSRSNAFINQWNEATWDNPSLAHLEPTDPSQVLNTPFGIFYLPSDIRYVIEDNTRTRTNGQLTLQFSPSDAFTATLDYTYAENELEAERSQQSTWFNFSNISFIEFNRNAIASPAIYVEDYPLPGEEGYGKDVSFAQQYFEATTTMDSIGLNLNWQVTDRLSFELDAHNSVAENVGLQKELGLNANIVIGEYADFTSDLPVMGITIDDSVLTKGNNDGILNGGDVSGAMGTVRYAKQETEISQLRLNGKFDLTDDSFLKFGAEIRKDTNTTRVDNGEATGRITMGNWGGVNPDIFGEGWDSFFTAENFGKAFPDYDVSTTNPRFLNFGLNADYHTIERRIEEIYASGVDPVNFKDFPGGKVQPNSFVTGIYNVDREIEEEVTSLFVQYGLDFTLNDMPANVVAGVRVEQTDITSTTNTFIPVELHWDDQDDWSQVLSNEQALISAKSDYRNVLPSLDFSVSPSEDVKVRFSASKTMARAGYADLRSAVAINNIRALTANIGNPALKPMESFNLDFSTEWYYDDASYLSVGLFYKKVSNFIGTDTFVSPWWDLRDPRTGPRYDEAVEQLRSEGIQLTDENIHTRMLINAGLDPNDETTYIAGNSDDDPALWITNTPVNDRDNEINGFEIAIQHWFGASGFGFQANYTAVNADVKFDVNKRGGQFAMIGLSDSANFSVFYDADGLQARLAYNWRDQFLDNRTQYNNEPSFTEAYSQIDASISYDLTDNLTLTAEGLNITGENSRRHSRTKEMMWSLEDLGARYSVGLRYNF